MSFSSEIKTELTAIENLSSCCYHAQVYGLVLFAHFTSFNMSIKTENPQVFKMYCDSMTNYIGCKFDIIKDDSKKMVASVEDNEQKKIALEKFGHSFRESSTRINHANFQDDCCISSFLRGAFLSCGSISDPEKSYHLEFVVPYKKLSNDLIAVLHELDLNPKYVQRKGYHIIYFKDSESIEDLLAYMGAQNASLYLMNIKIEKDIKNKVNRKLNFEMHNLNKTISASNTQIEAIEYILSTSGLGILPDNLKKLAMIRYDNPEATLKELEEMLDENISKSGIKHRLDKIVEISNNLKHSKTED